MFVIDGQSLNYLDGNLVWLNRVMQILKKWIGAKLMDFKNIFLYHIVDKCQRLLSFTLKFLYLTLFILL